MEIQFRKFKINCLKTAYQNNTQIGITANIRRIVARYGVDDDEWDRGYIFTIISVYVFQIKLKIRKMKIMKTC